MSGEPYTSRGVRTVWGGVLGNLSWEHEKAAGSYSTLCLVHGQGGNIPDSVKIDTDEIERYGGYGVDATGNGGADPWDIEDAVFSAAHYLAANGATNGDVEGAVFAYNRADWYVDDVLDLADSYVDGYVTIDFDNLPSGKVGELVQVGTQWIGESTYVFGAGRNRDDQEEGIFDCSSFVHWAFEEVGVELGELQSVTTDTLKHMGQSVSVSDIQPGDLFFFDTYKRDGHVGSMPVMENLLVHNQVQGLILKVWKMAIGQMYLTDVCNGLDKRNFVVLQKYLDYFPFYLSKRQIFYTF
ncbi:NlpC/P60 family protein [Salipaludibacillus sp. CF4.18]|uniref:C40 family peptidase n=1 Tax=Salipaludibacillus sp. CF4.18 TaxID=3373081 RepID=UPI003EE437C1